jgi:hypothetical protein
MIRAQSTSLVPQAEVRSYPSIHYPVSEFFGSEWADLAATRV